MSNIEQWDLVVWLRLPIPLGVEGVEKRPYAAAAATADASLLSEFSPNIFT